MSLNQSQKTQLKTLVEPNHFLDSPAECMAYSYDNSRYRGMPEAVMLASSSQQIAHIIRYCAAEGIPVYTRGKGTATTGASVPTAGGIVLSLEQMQQVIALNVDNRFIKVEPGITNAQVQKLVGEHGFFWAPDPSSASTCTVGGNLACNAAGPRAVKYGSCRENTLGLTVVTGTGDVLKLGVCTTKGVVGYDFTRLLIGSEGSLGIITEATLKLLPKAEAKACLQIFYSDMHHCAEGITRIMSQGLIPCALEFIDTACLDIIRKHAQHSIPEQAKAMLMVEVEGLAAELSTCITKIKQAADNSGLVQITTAQQEDEIAKLWLLRKALSPGLRSIAPKKINEDIVVPVSKLPEYIAFTQDLARQHGLCIVNFGHAGNGNMHTNIMLDPSDQQQNQAAKICLHQLFTRVLSLGGTLSGEHGIGLDKREFIREELAEPVIELMHQVKRIFDPQGILNPGKVIPDLKS